MTFEEMHAVVATAHNHKLKVTGHCRATQGIKNALRAGYDAIEHGTFMDDEALEMLLERDVPCVPALYFEKASVELGRDFGLSQAVIDGHKETLDAGSESARRILRAGGRDVGLTPIEVISCATKTGAEIMGRGADFGTLEVGKLADVLLVDGDVIADISLLEDRKNILAVMQSGVLKAGRLAKQFPTMVRRER
jgi:imidazolonepropionase-like amidohydrolase